MRKSNVSGFSVLELMVAMLVVAIVLTNFATIVETKAKAYTRLKHALTLDDKVAEVQMNLGVPDACRKNFAGTVIDPANIAGVQVPSVRCFNNSAAESPCASDGATVVEIGGTYQGVSVADIRIFPVANIKAGEIVAELGMETRDAGNGAALGNRSVSIWARLDAESKIVECAANNSQLNVNEQTDLQCGLQSGGHAYFDPVQNKCVPLFQDAVPYTVPGSTYVECPAGMERAPLPVAGAYWLKKYYSDETDPALKDQINKDLRFGFNACSVSVSSDATGQYGGTGATREYTNSISEARDHLNWRAFAENAGCKCIYAADLTVYSFNCTILCVPAGSP